MTLAIAAKCGFEPNFTDFLHRSQSRLSETGKTDPEIQPTADIQQQIAMLR